LSVIVGNSEISVETSLLDQGITLMLVGMGTVFTFLTILVFGMSTMSAITMRFTRSTAGNDASDEEVAAIMAAIAQHRNNSTK
jgi:oxaloacetate decarboxylase gamma subunit